MIKTYKILSALLSYPGDELKEFLPEVTGILKEEALLKDPYINGIADFANYYRNTGVIEWQEQFVQLFDFSRSVSLHLFEHVHGDSRDRGQAMVDLADEYAKEGLQMKNGELPDYLPVFLEYLSLLDQQKAAEMLAEPVHIIAAIQQRLEEKDQPYKYIFEALISLSAKKVAKEAVENIIKNQKPMDFDKEYEEEPVRFGGADNPCNSCNQ